MKSGSKVIREIIARKEGEPGNEARLSMACVVNSEWNFPFLDIDCMHTEGNILPLLSVELANIPLLRLPSHISADHMTLLRWPFS